MSSPYSICKADRIHRKILVLTRLARRFYEENETDKLCEILSDALDTTLRNIEAVVDAHCEHTLLTALLRNPYTASFYDVDELCCLLNVPSPKSPITTP